MPHRCQLRQDPKLQKMKLCHSSHTSRNPHNTPLQRVLFFMKPNYCAQDLPVQHEFNGYVQWFKSKEQGPFYSFISLGLNEFNQWFIKFWLGHLWSRSNLVHKPNQIYSNIKFQARESIRDEVSWRLGAGPVGGASWMSAIWLKVCTLIQ